MGILDKAASLWSGGSQTNPSFINPTQSPYLEDVYKGAQNTYASNDGSDYGAKFQQPAYQGFNQLIQGGNMIPNLIPSLMNFGARQNKYLDVSVQTGLDSMAQNFQRNIMPSIKQGSALAGTSGGSRQGIAESNAINDFNKESSNFINQMYSGNFQNQMANELGAYNQVGNLQNQQNQSIMSGLRLANPLAQMGFDNQYGNIRNYADVIGGPTVMGGGGQTQAGIGDMVNSAMAGAYLMKK